MSTHSPSSPYTAPKIFVRYVVDAMNQWDVEFSEHAPVAGQFIQGPDGRSFRIAEVWDIQEKHGAMVHGLTAFLESVDVMKHALGRYAPDYYGKK